jgi:NADPH-dependent F420 reductase
MNDPGSESSGRPVLAVVGGTGNLGLGLALRWAQAGYRVGLGSRDAQRARAAAAEGAQQAGASITGGSNAEVAAAADIVIVTVPFAAQAATLEEIRAASQHKIVVDTTVPLVPPKVMRVQLPPEGSAARRAQNLLGPQVRVVSAFQNIAAAHLRELSHPLEGDVLVSGDDADAREAVVRLAQALGLAAWQAGALDNAVVAEALTSVLIFMNKRYGFDGAGIRICGTRQAG